MSDHEKVEAEGGGLGGQGEVEQKGGEDTPAGLVKEGVEQPHQQGDADYQQKHQQPTEPPAEQCGHQMIAGNKEFK